MRTIAVLLLAGMVAWPARAQAPQGGLASEEDRLSIEQFERQVAAYVELHRRLEGPIPTLESSEDLRLVREAVGTLRRAIRSARRHARQGDLFTPDVVRAFRSRLDACITWEDLAAMRADEEEDHGIAPRRVKVNDAWPSGAPFTFVPPRLLEALPALPPELQYRIIGPSLVLWDHHADLIVDFFAAFPR